MAVANGSSCPPWLSEADSPAQRRSVVKDLHTQPQGSWATRCFGSVRSRVVLKASTAVAVAGVAASVAAASASAYSVTIDGHTVSTNAKLAATVPASVRSTGMTDITYNNAPPDEQVVNGKNVGWEIDLGRAVAAMLGLKWNLTTSGNFDSFI